MSFYDKLQYVKNNLFTVDQMSDKLWVSKVTINKYKKDGRLESYKLWKATLIYWNDSMKIEVKNWRPLKLKK